MGLLILSALDVDQATSKFTPDELVDLMAKVFTNLSGNTQEAKEGAEGVCIPHRGTILSSNHRVLFMPSRLSAIGTAIKIVSVPTPSAPADARERGLPASTMVIDDRTGEVTAVINARKLTALRNAASKSVPWHRPTFHSIYDARFTPCKPIICSTTMSLGIFPSCPRGYRRRSSDCCTSVPLSFFLPFYHRMQDIQSIGKRQVALVGGIAQSDASFRSIYGRSPTE